MQTPRPAPYDCVQAEKTLQAQVAALIQKEEQCIHGIMTRKKTSKKWWLVLFLIPLILHNNIGNITKNTMIRVSQTAREVFTHTSNNTEALREIREQQDVFSRDFASLAATVQDLQQRFDRNQSTADSLERAVGETQEKMIHAGEVASVLEKRINDVQTAVEISTASPVILDKLDKRKKRALPHLTEVEGARPYHAPTAASQAKNEKPTYVMGIDGLTRLQDL